MLKLVDITYTINNKTLLDKVSLEIKPGSMTAIMGLNGAGKTTLLKIISSFIKPALGSVFLEDKNINTFSSKTLAQKTAFVPQEFPTDFPFTVYEFVMMGRFAWQTGLFNQAKDHEQTALVLKKLDLFDFAQRTITSLSGGEKQRVLLARAIIQSTPIILLDEPFNHLDIKNKQGLCRLLENENKENQKTIIAIMHDFSIAQKYFNHVIFLKHGEKIFDGSAKEGFAKHYLQQTFEVDSIN